MKLHTKLISMVLAAMLCLSLAFSGVATENSAPVAENLEIVTYRGVSVGGRLSAVDPNGDTVTFEITTKPTKGRVELQEDGRFIYTPNSGKKGRDYFGYKAIDSAGNYSQEATVIIKIQKQKTNVIYSDMSSHPAHYAALYLAEKGVFTGECLGGEYIFHPDREVTRGEFLAMCMKLADYDILSGVRSTGFMDDDEIPGWVKPYVSTALMEGVVTGYTDAERGAVFNANNVISYTESAVILNNVIDISDVANADRYNEASVPAWAYQATANLNACDIVPAGMNSMEETLTRAQVAEMLLGAARVLENR
ncbi:MAG: Ig-like domain-containing protein [Oscillospiraceae bacterium]